jgi:gamma-glutamyltranspeptidase/glutathione hydrolase
MLISSKIRYLFITVIFFLSTEISFGGNPVRSKNGMVVSANELATKVGVQILKTGGNAVDAAVAVGFALAVTYPSAGNIGGGGFMVIHLANGKNTTIDFREAAPLAAHEKMFLDELGNYVPSLSQAGWKASGVPGTVAGLIYALEKYGTMKLKEVIQPAIDLAENGFVLSYKNSEIGNYAFENLSKVESTKKIFTNNGKKFIEGDLLIQIELANTLKLIRDKGRDEFYKGEIAKKIVEQSKLFGGLFTLKDFEDYEAIERTPIEGNYKGYKIISMAPPSSGGICILETLNVLENFQFTKDDWNSSLYLHALIETWKYVYADRSEHMGDPDFYNVPQDILISKKYASEIKSSIKRNAIPSLQIHAKVLTKNEKEETTHYSIADKFGNAVSTTYTLNDSYGNKIVVDGLGFLLNNEMDDFSAKPGTQNMYGLLGSKANSIQPRKRMLSSMTPTIILKDEKPFLIIGSPGGSTIITSVLQTIVNVIDFKMNIFDAIAAPKIHHQWLPDEIDYERFVMTDDVKQNLISRGHKLGKERSLGRLEGIIFDINTNTFTGASDPRGYGLAAGF